MTPEHIILLNADKAQRFPRKANVRCILRRHFHDYNTSHLGWLIPQ